MKKMNISITFDYELFFGENKSSYSSVLFEPTKLLIDTLYEEDVSATFFVDICSLVQAEKYDQQDYIKGFSAQLLYMLEKKQDVQLHIHPHWLNSKFEDGKWIFDNNSYRIHSFGFNSQNEGANKIIRDGVSYLNNILQPSYPDYSCIAFRAGGFCLQPHKDLVKTLYENGIRVDSSVAPQLKSNDQSHAYDYRKKELEMNWYISSEGDWWENRRTDRHALFEVPIATIDKNPLTFSLKRLINPGSIKLYLEEKRGTYIGAGSNDKKSTIGNIWNCVSGYNAVSLDAYQARFIKQQLDRMLRRNASGDGNSYVALIGHPKLVTKKYIENLKCIIELLKKDTHFEFISISEIWRKEGSGDE